MSSTQISPHSSEACRPIHRTSVGAITAAAACLILSCTIFTAEALAQRNFSRTYQARRNVSLHLINRSGSITVEGWERNEIRVVASMESSAARIAPQLSDDGLKIDVVRDNREDVGDVNFRIQVPVGSSVDIETRRGNITINSVQGSLVRAYVTSEGDIDLTRIRAAFVWAKNMMGNILFDGELLRGGTYEFQTVQGDINIRIPANSEFRLTATAPGTRNINLGGFAEMGLFNFVSGRRQVIGRVGDGQAALTVLSQRGPIIFTGR